MNRIQGLCLVLILTVNIPIKILAQAAPDPFYPTNTNLQLQLQSLANDFPAIVQFQEIGRATNGDLPIMALKLSANVNAVEDEPVWIFTGIIHGTEQIGLRVLLDLAYELALGYGVDSDVTDWLNAYEIWLVMSMNPWGYEHSSFGTPSSLGTRKNGASSTNTNNSGVDLNRNFDFRWFNGGSSDPSDSRFRGPAAFSENETQAIRDLYLDRKPVFGATFHQGNDSDGGEIMRPWSTSQIEPPPDAFLLFNYAQRYANWVFDSRSVGSFCEKDGGGNFILQDPDGNSCGNDESAFTFCAELCWKPAHKTLSAIGQSSNWYYSAVGTFDFTIEISDRLFNKTFLHNSIGPQSAYQHKIKNIVTEFARNYREGIKSWFQHFLYSAETSQFTGPGFTGHITDAQSGEPLSAVIEVTGFTHSFIVDRTSDSAFGRFWRFLPAGTYSVTISALGYETWQDNITVENNGPLTELQVALTPQTTLVESEENYLGDYHLSPAYPNPSYSQTQFTLSINQQQRVQILVYDMLGRRVAELHKDIIAAGKTYTFKLDTMNLPSGLYLVQILGEYFQAVKMITTVK